MTIGFAVVFGEDKIDTELVKLHILFTFCDKEDQSIGDGISAVSERQKKPPSKLRLLAQRPPKGETNSLQQAL